MPEICSLIYIPQKQLNRVAIFYEYNCRWSSDISRAQTFLEVTPVFYKVKTCDLLQPCDIVRRKSHFQTRQSKINPSGPL